MDDRGDGEGVQELKELVAEKTHGPLVSWLAHFDKNGDGDIDAAEFNEAMEELKYPGDAQELFRLVDADNSGTLTWNEVNAWSCDLWAAFRRWCGQTFSCPDDMVAKLSQDICGHLRQISGRKVSILPGKEVSILGVHSDGPRSFNEAQFVRNAVRLGWYGSFEPVLFKCLDKAGAGRVTAANLAWLEQEHNLYLKRCKTKTRHMGTRDMAKAARSLQSFLAFLRMRFGFPYRGWRSVLDKEGHLVVNRRELLKACNELGWHGDVAALWHAMDSEDSGCSTLDAFSAAEARALAIFRRWAVEAHGSVKAGFRALLLGSHHKCKSKGKLDKEGWIVACQWERVTFDHTWVFHLFDWEQTGLISFKEVKFLESWRPADWLSAARNPKAAEDFKRQLLDSGQHVVKAWRLLIDTDSSGKVTYKEFKRGADALEFRGDSPGAFLALDRHGFCELTLNEIDESVARSLSEFRRWAYAEFGGVMLAFKALDKDGSGALSWREFRQAFNRHHFKGDISTLFNSLNVNGDGSIDKSEVSFLDDWELDMLQHHEDPSHGLSEVQRVMSLKKRDSADRHQALRRLKGKAENLSPAASSVSGAKLLQLIGWDSAAAGDGQERNLSKLFTAASAPTSPNSKAGTPKPGVFMPSATPRSHSRARQLFLEDSGTTMSWPASPPPTAHMAWSARASPESPRYGWEQGLFPSERAWEALRRPSGLSRSSYRSSPAGRSTTPFSSSGAKTPRTPSSPGPGGRFGNLTLTFDP